MKLKKISALLISATLVTIPITGTACTSFTLPGTDGGYVYGRSMEFGIPLKSALVVIPRGYTNQGVGTNSEPGTGLNWVSKYGVAGLNALGQPIVVDGINEKGMAGGLLNAPNTAVYQNTLTRDSANSIASYQMLLYALSNFATVDEAKAGFQQIQVNSSPLAAYKGVVQVRMTLHDTNGKSIVVEYLKGHLVITDNPTGVMTNDPAFIWHLDNIGNYANLTPVERDAVKINGANYAPPSSGSGLHGLPGDSLSPSRFIRAIAYTTAAPKKLNSAQQVNAAWHILNNFDIPPGSIRLPSSNPYGGGAGGYETTEWSTVADAKNLTYQVRTYDNQTIQQFDLKQADLNGKEIRTILLKTTPLVDRLN